MPESDSTNKDEKTLSFGDRLYYAFWGFMLELFLTSASGRKGGGWMLLLLFASIVCLAIAFSMLVGQIVSSFQPPLSEQVANQVGGLESSIEGLRNAESLLKKMKDDIEQTDRARQQIEKDLQMAEKLKGVTDEQLEAMASVLKRKSWWDWWAATITGVITGVSSTVVVGVGRRIWKGWKGSPQ